MQSRKKIVRIERKVCRDKIEWVFWQFRKAKKRRKEINMLKIPIRFANRIKYWIGIEEKNQQSKVLISIIIILSRAIICFYLRFFSSNVFLLSTLPLSFLVNWYCATLETDRETDWGQWTSHTIHYFNIAHYLRTGLILSFDFILSVN